MTTCPSSTPTAPPRPGEHEARSPLDSWLDRLRCPRTGQALRREGRRLTTLDGAVAYPVSETGIPLFAADACSPDGRTQQRHYDRIADLYTCNLAYPHTLEYTAALDQISATLDRRPR